jgi:pilus assembly protein FimV
MAFDPDLRKVRERRRESMNCSNRISASALLAVASLAVSPAAWSLGLGEATVESYLNQPFRARIDLITQASDDLGSVTAQLASAADYELIGVSVEGIPVPMRFTVEDIDGDAYLAASSKLPISDPVVRLIVEVNWSSGRMLREYTLFLDPPSVPDAAPAPRIEQRAAVSAPPAARPAEPLEERAAEPAAEPVVEPAAEPAAPESRVGPVSGSEYGPVRSGETLWGIASGWARGSGLSVNQVMIAIQRENPNAFLNNNINLLKRGAILRLPSAAEIERISRAVANQEVASQAEEFSGVKAAESVISPTTPLLADESAAMPQAAIEPAPVAAEEPAATPADSAQEPLDATADADIAAAETAAPETAQDLLELVPPSEASELDSGYGFEESEQEVGPDADVTALRENLARTEEELITQQQQNTYLEERIRELESQLESAEQGSVEDADLAAMEDRLQQQRQAAPAREAPWYNRLSSWVIGLLVVVAAFAGWLLSRRGRAGAIEAAAEESLRSIQSEAEDVLRVLAEDEDKPGGKADAAKSAQAAPKPGPSEGAAQPAPRPPATGVDAELLDEDSSDPEIQLDLARAYISMGDKEAARVILDEVINNGNEEQQAEARKMLEVLLS